ncbi:peptide ABC transporter substrate-binding protein [Candidatus Leptofilum sp.]|uniref:peptide ABC transporter substrate-binding protein n=1 Tax=Candidatus Leptofilum sp. TaxID=3241576 RepID=UPI003B5C7CBB
MQKAKKRAAVPSFVALCFILLIACTTPEEPATQTPTPPIEEEATPIVTEIVVTAIAEVPTAVPTSVPATEPKALVVCMSQEPDSLYPHGSTTLAATAVQHAIFENNITTLSFDYQAQGLEKIPSLVDGDARIVPIEVNSGDIAVAADGNLVIVEPGIALTNSNGEVTMFDGVPIEMEQLIVDFTMKERRWSDGMPVTAHDSVYSYNLVADPNTPQSKFTINRTASYVATDNLTTRWVGVPGFYDTTYFTNFWQPLPEHIWGELSAAELLVTEASRRLPVGDGPFAIKEWIPGEQIQLVPNPFYYQEGLPHLDSLTYKFIPETNQLISQLLSGECDIGTQDALGSEHTPFLLEAESNGLLVPYFQTGTVWEHIDFGINPEPAHAVTRPDWYEDVRVRQAIAMCTNRQRMVDDILFGRSEVVHVYIPNSHPLFANGLTEWPHDLIAASALLDEAGFLDNNGDGIREAPSTETPFSPTLITTLENDMRNQLVQYFKEDLLACGIEVQLSYFLSGDLYAPGPNGPLFGRRFDLSEFAWSTGVQPPCQYFLSSQIPAAVNDWTGQNNSGFTNEAFDDACLQAIRSIPGTAAYRDGHAEAQRIFAEQLPILPLFLRLRVAAARPEVLNFGVDSTQESELYNIHQIDLRE